MHTPAVAPAELGCQDWNHNTARVRVVLRDGLTLRPRANEMKGAVMG